MALGVLLGGGAVEIKILSPGAFASAQVLLGGGDSFVSEAGLMVRMDAHIDLDVTTRPKGKGGMFAGLKRMVGGDSFFLSTYHASSPGEVVLAPILPGTCTTWSWTGGLRGCARARPTWGRGRRWSVDTQFQGFKGLFSGESLFFMECAGVGPLLVNAFGRIREVEIDGST